MKIDRPMKNVMIFGDSYSTFEGYIPEGYAVYYFEKGREETDVNRVEQTWWHLLCKDMELDLVRNDSWSGSTLCNTGYDGDCSETSSFICRLDKLIDEGFFEKNDIDTVFVFGCTNDHYAGSPLGELKLDDQSEQDLFSVCPAICYFIGKLRKTLPRANIVSIINTGMKAAIGEAIKAASKHYGTDFIELCDIDKSHAHPTIKGMAQIKEQVKMVVTGK